MTNTQPMIPTELPEPRPVSMENLAKRLARLLVENEGYREPRNPFGFEETRESIRQIGAIIHEVSGLPGMLRVFHWIEENFGADVAHPLEALWESVGEWRY